MEITLINFIVPNKNNLPATKKIFLIVLFLLYFYSIFCYKFICQKMRKKLVLNFDK